MLHLILQVAAEAAVLGSGSDSALERPIWRLVDLVQDHLGLVFLGLAVLYGFYRYVIDVPKP
ncbi:MAG TPA: hypothetical protein VF406_14030 [Thermodesulfobacteriota bacterium]